MDERDAARGGDEEDEDDADFDPRYEVQNAGEVASSSNDHVSAAAAGAAAEEEACVVDAGELGLMADEDYDGSFLELGSDQEEEDEDEDEDEEDEDGEVDDERNDDLGAVLDETRSVEVNGDVSGTVLEENHDRQGGPGYILGESGVGSEVRAEFGDEYGECGVRAGECGHEEDELMGNALEGLPELHSPGHEEGYGLHDAQNNVEDEETVMDAISKRTRAQFSLADMTLDQLETFLQESDEDDYFHNVDDEEEYRKFLTAVMGDGQGDAATTKDDEDDDEDEEDDDFELEIEEALESDNEETLRAERRIRPETRELRRERLQRPLGVSKTGLRPLVPYPGNTLLPELPFGDRCRVMLDTAYKQSQPSTAGLAYGNCFTPEQVGQLHVLIHEHVQLLVQVFSMCILDSARQDIAISTHRLLTQLVSRIDSEVVRTQPWPEVCFRAPYIRSSVSEEYNPWCPSVTPPVYSVVKVAPLSVIKEYLQDVSDVVQDYKQCHIQEKVYNSQKQPMFEVPEKPSSAAPQLYSTSQAKKSMAALLVENTKRQSIAPVPRGIVKACSRFAPFFNPALFPHKPPPPSTAGRLLFTDAEDELLALGLMTFNNDWDAIKERFLPTKTTHQIFVRQKNRTTARAPENSIKAVRRMKTSPLTVEEKENIQEAVRYFKYDWAKVWQYAVPHRDPGLLPRQWRTALGTQKSYKGDDVSKEKRRLNEAAKKRKMKGLEDDASVADGRGEITNSDEDHEETREFSKTATTPRLPVMTYPSPFSAPVPFPCPSTSIYPNTNTNPRSLANDKTVRLAPDLPCLNLPPHVRVFKRVAQPNGRARAVQLQPVQLHPLLLQPCFIEPPPPPPPPPPPEPPEVRPFVSNPQNSAFHPFFGKVSAALLEPPAMTLRIPPSKPKPGTRRPSSSFHPLLEQGGGIPQPSSKRQRAAPRAPRRSRNVVGVVGVRIEEPAREPEPGVQFECEEMNDSDKEDDKKEIEFEEEEIGSQSEDEAQPAVRPSRIDRMNNSAGRDADVEAAQVLTGIQQNSTQ